MFQEQPICTNIFIELAFYETLYIHKNNNLQYDRQQHKGTYTMV